jgi:hypothetical protein
VGEDVSFWYGRMRVDVGMGGWVFVVVITHPNTQPHPHNIISCFGFFILSTHRKE